MNGKTRTMVEFDTWCKGVVNIMFFKELKYLKIVKE
jgi:hypothetical protein